MARWDTAPIEESDGTLVSAFRLHGNQADGFLVVRNGLEYFFTFKRLQYTQVGQLSVYFCPYLIALGSR